MVKNPFLHILKRLIIAIFVTALSLILLSSAAFVYLIATPFGGKILVRCLKLGFSPVGHIHTGLYQGSLQEGFILKDVRIANLVFLPDALVRIQEIRVRLPIWDLAHSDLGIFNGRIAIPGSDAVVFNVDVDAGKVKGSLYSKYLDLRAINRFWINDEIRKNVQGFVSNIDLAFQGPVSSPQIQGTFNADNIQYRSIILTNGMVRLDLSLLPRIGQIQVKGSLFLNAGVVNVHNTNLHLAPSKLNFQGDLFDPILDIHLGAKVEDMEVNLTIKGIADSPQLTVSSDPPMPAQDALQVLFTGNAWCASTSPFHGATSSQLAQDFLNYSLRDINDRQQLGFKTKLTDNLKLGAEMDQTPLAVGETNIYYSRKVNGEMDLSEHMSLNVSHEIMAQDSYPSYENGDPQDETQVYLQYKKRF